MSLTRPPNRAEHDHFVVARYLLTDRAPYFARLAFSLTPLVIADAPEPVETIDSKLRLYMTPFVVDTPAMELSNRIEHLINHVMRAHEARLSPCEKQEVAAMCGCMEINDDYDGHPHPKDFELPEHQTAEWYYRQIEDQFKQVTMTHCGSGSGAEGDEWEVEGAESDDLSEMDIELLKRSTAEAVEEWQKSRGNVPQGILRWASETLGPAKVPWERTLASFIRQGLTYTQGRQDYSMRRPNRRGGEVIRPSLVKPVPKIGVVVDTSGSMAIPFSPAPHPRGSIDCPQTTRQTYQYQIAKWSPIH